MPETFPLIPGRTSTQGTTLNEGKYTEGYVTETSLLRMARPTCSGWNWPTARKCGRGGGGGPRGGTSKSTL